MNTYRPDNHVIAGLILVALSEAPDQVAAIESVLDRYYPSRRVKAAATGKSGAAARSGDCETSRDAAASVNVRKSEAVVLVTLGRAKKASLTTYEIEHLSGTRYGSITPRMKPLLNKGFVQKVGVERMSGNGRTLYALTAAGRLAALAATIKGEAHA